jgi:hypothetical protein
MEEEKRYYYINEGQANELKIRKFAIVPYDLFLSSPRIAFIFWRLQEYMVNNTIYLKNEKSLFELLAKINVKRSLFYRAVWMLKRMGYLKTTYDVAYRHRDPRKDAYHKGRTLHFLYGYDPEKDIIVAKKYILPHKPR